MYTNVTYNILYLHLYSVFECTLINTYILSVVEGYEKRHDAFVKDILIPRLSVKEVCQNQWTVMRINRMVRVLQAVEMWGVVGRWATVRMHQ